MHQELYLIQINRDFSHNIYIFVPSTNSPLHNIYSTSRKCLYYRVAGFVVIFQHSLKNP